MPPGPRPRCKPRRDACSGSGRARPSACSRCASCRCPPGRRTARRRASPTTTTSDRALGPAPDAAPDRPGAGAAPTGEREIAFEADGARLRQRQPTTVTADGQRGAALGRPVGARRRGQLEPHDRPDRRHRQHPLRRRGRQPAVHRPARADRRAQGRGDGATCCSRSAKAAGWRRSKGGAATTATSCSTAPPIRAARWSTTNGCPKQPSWRVTARRVVYDAETKTRALRGRLPRAVRAAAAAAARPVDPLRRRRQLGLPDPRLRPHRHRTGSRSAAAITGASPTTAT